MKDFLLIKSSTFTELDLKNEISDYHSCLSKDDLILIQTFYNENDVTDIDWYGFSNLVSDEGMVENYLSAKKSLIGNSMIYGSWIEVSDKEISVRTDHLGAQKVYYYSSDQVLIISTNLKYILSVMSKLSIGFSLNIEQATLYLYMRETKWPETIVKEVKTFKPASVVKIRDNRISTNHYQVFKDTDKTPYDEVIGLLSTLTKNKTCTTLSGGVDSQCLAKVCADIEIKKAITCAYASSKKSNEYNSFDERPYARLLTDALETELIEKEFSVDDVKHARKKLINDIEQPAHDPTSFYLMSESLSKSGIENIITGMGGDALFSPSADLNRARSVYSIYNKLLKYLPKKILMFFIVRANFRGPFNYLYQLVNSNRALEFHELIDLSRPHHYTSVVEKALSKNAISKAKSRYFTLDRKSLFSQYESELTMFSVKVKWKLNAAVLLNPDEYNVEITTKKNGLRALMPLSMPSFVLSCLSQGKLDRTKEIELLKFDIQGTLMKKKSGFTIPYEEWWKCLFGETLKSILNDSHFIKKMALDIPYLSSLIEKDRLNRSEAAFIQRLDMLYNYLSVNKINY